MEDWRAGLPVGGRASMDTFLRTVARKDNWTHPDIKALKGKKYKGLSELRWSFDGVPYRLIGYTVSDHTFLGLIGCTHDSKKYKPPSALDSAVERKKLIANEKATTSEYRLHTDQGTA